ncbi:unnamed protein product [Acanthoscelides obtectus]|uniref:Uncharacterized protein n=1 Tax=Acanthoscelides obtectus TaxID=200917 RepID=A0A9P0P819_ACAOB|nr:unnamed protein product [Acanthoscelides obtectus]CAK1620605.1 hypothetical protein AOBTE_LOCUS468 [Acanthoscelides obtectus]
MEIEIGFCDFCGADRVLCEIKRHTFQKLIRNLFNQHVRAEVLEDLFESLKLCPLCHEKCILLNAQYKAINSYKKGKKNDNCIMCGNEDEIYKIQDWSHFSSISEDFSFEAETVPICSACLVYIDHRNTIKQHLLQKNVQERVSAATGMSLSSIRRVKKEARNIKEHVYTEKCAMLPITKGVKKHYARKYTNWDSGGRNLNPTENY